MKNAFKKETFVNEEEFSLYLSSLKEDQLQKNLSLIGLKDHLSLQYNGRFSYASLTKSTYSGELEI